MSNCQLGLGFGAGGPTFRRVAKQQGGVDISDEQSQTAVKVWRNEYADIVRGWSKCHNALRLIERGSVGDPIDPLGLVRTIDGGLQLPSGRQIRYPGLERDEDGDYSYGNVPRYKARVHGPKVDENIVQALARDVVFNAAYEFWKRTKYVYNLMVHDELIYVVPEDDAERLDGILEECLRTPPSYWPELVLWSEGGWAQVYGEAK